MGALGMRGVTASASSNLVFRRAFCRTFAPPIYLSTSLSLDNLRASAKRLKIALQLPDYRRNRRSSSGLADKKIVPSAAWQ